MFRLFSKFLVTPNLFALIIPMESDIVNYHFVNSWIFAVFVEYV